MPIIKITLSCSNESFEKEIKLNEVISEAFMNIISKYPKYYDKLNIHGMEYNGKSINHNDTFIESSIKEGDEIKIICDLINKNTDSNSEEDETNVFYLTYKVRRHKKNIISLISNNKYKIWNYEKS